MQSSMLLDVRAKRCWPSSAMSSSIRLSPPSSSGSHSLAASGMKSSFPSSHATNGTLPMLATAVTCRRMPKSTVEVSSGACDWEKSRVYTIPSAPAYTT